MFRSKVSFLARSIPIIQASISIVSEQQPVDLGVAVSVYQDPLIEAEKVDSSSTNQIIMIPKC